MELLLDKLVTCLSVIPQINLPAYANVPYRPRRPRYEAILRQKLGRAAD